MLSIQWHAWRICQGSLTNAPTNNMQTFFLSPWLFSFSLSCHNLIVSMWPNMFSTLHPSKGIHPMTHSTLITRWTLGATPCCLYLDMWCTYLDPCLYVSWSMLQVPEWGHIWGLHCMHTSPITWHAYITSHDVLWVDAIVQVHCEPWQWISHCNSSVCLGFAMVVRNSWANMVPLEIGNIICGI